MIDTLLKHRPSFIKPHFNKLNLTTTKYFVLLIAQIS